MLALIALRVTIGLHFSVEGIDKFIDPKPFSAGFLMASKGPLAPLLKAFVWDRDGLARLDDKTTLAMWEDYQQQVEQRFNLDEKGKQAAKRVRERHESLLKAHFDQYRDDIHQYREGVARRNDYQRDRMRRDVASLRGQTDTMEGELYVKRAELLDPIDRIWASYEAEMNRLGAEQGRTLALPKPKRYPLNSDVIDVIIRYFDITVGVLLICGLFTRVAAVAGALFLLSICASQWPFTPGAAPIWYQLIEAMAMFVLAALGAGQYAGFDSILGPLRNWCCPPKQGT